MTERTGPKRVPTGARIVIGIDPGTHTGIAHWDTWAQRYESIESMPIHRAMDAVRTLHLAGQLRAVVFEDARLRKWLGAKGREALQGAGSIKRDCKIWTDFLADIGVPFRHIKPLPGVTKWPADKFAKLTGWAGRTNEHGRDAALLVWGAR